MLVGSEVEKLLIRLKDKKPRQTNTKKIKISPRRKRWWVFNRERALDVKKSGPNPAPHRG